MAIVMYRKAGSCRVRWEPVFLTGERALADLGEGRMKREDFVFTIGYSGEVAMVDGNAKRSYSHMSTRELAEAGLFKPALCSALYSGNQAELQEVLAAYREKAENPSMTADQLKRTLGVFAVPESIVRVKII